MPDPSPPPAPAYFPTSATSPLHPPRALYARLKALRQQPDALVKTQDFEVPPRSGRAWTVPAGALFRLSTPKGPQVGDLNIFHASNPREHFWAARTRQLQSSHVREGDRLWSNLPYMRPMCGLIEDGCSVRAAGREDHVDESGKSVTQWGGRCHDLFGTRCDPYVSYMLTGESYDFSCHSNLVRAVLPYSLTETDIHDVVNVFQVTGLDSQGRYFMEASPATEDSFATFFAELPLLCALSTCPGGDLSAWGWSQGDAEGEEKKDMKSTCRPIRVEVFEITEAVRGEVLEGWKQPEASGYRGLHGMNVPGGEA